MTFYAAPFFFSFPFSYSCVQWISAEVENALALGFVGMVSNVGVTASYLSFRNSYQGPVLAQIFYCRGYVVVVQFGGKERLLQIHE